jgi:hypothetical protein
MIERRGRTRLLLEARLAIRVGAMPPVPSGAMI